MSEDKFRCHNNDCDGIIKPKKWGGVGIGEPQPIPIHGECDKCGQVYRLSEKTGNFYKI